MKDLYFITLVASATFLFSCKQKQDVSIVALQPKLIENAEASCPFITKDNRDNIVLSWVRKIDTSNSVLCYAISTDNGKTFGKAIEIPASTSVHAHAENLPKMVFKPSGEIIAAWGAANPNPKNAYAGLVYYAQSFNNGKNWSSATPLVKDPLGIDQRYFDVVVLPGGEAAISWLDNRKKTNRAGSALYLAKTNGNSGFINEQLISGPCCECCRTDLFVDSKKNIHILYRAIINDSIRDMVHIVSTDNGHSFTRPVKISNDNWVINGCPHTGPAMAENNYGLHFAWFTAGSGTGVFYDHSTDNGNTFSAKDSLSSRTGRHPQLTVLPNGNIAIVWDETFANGTGASSRIGFELRTPEGNKIMKDYVSEVSESATFPVILSINNKQVLIAYTTNSSEKNSVFYKTIRIK